MKYETEIKEGNGFHPVTITIETEKELKTLLHILSVKENISLNGFIGESLVNEVSTKKNIDLSPYEQIYNLKKSLEKKISDIWWSI